MIIARGAEAVLSREGNSLVKERVKKGYRIPELDERIRRERTRREANLLSEARRAGVPTPTILEVNEKNFKVVMAFVDGERLKELIDKGCDLKVIGTAVGVNIGKLHTAGIVHGDLTTSNMILSEGKVYFIDFGLGFFSERPEDYAIDLAVLREAVKSTHFKHLNALWGHIIQGYKDAFGNSEKVLKSLDNIEMRGRYVRRDE